MNSILDEMLKKYNAKNIEEQKNAVKEVLQEIVLCGLSRAGFFDKVAFYGGTALRIFYGLDRFSEDLDFSLKVPDENFDLTSYFPMLEKEVNSFGVHLKIENKEKSIDSNIKSAFVKGNTKEHLLMFYTDDGVIGGINKNELLRIKFEVDINPPASASFEQKFQLVPSPYEITLYDVPSLFACKIHAILCRGWKSRIKGRDLYDYVFYLQRGATLNVEHLKQRLVQTGVWEKDKELTIEEVKKLLNERFDGIDYENAKLDVKDFVKDKPALNIWSANFFKAITNNLK